MVSRVIKFSCFFFLSFLFLVLASIFYVILVKVNAQLLQRCLIWCVSFFSKMGIILFKIEFKGGDKELIVKSLTGRNHTDPKYGKLIVSNHLGYLDVLVLASLSPAQFVTSVEVKDTPGLGYMARLGGCLFVERRNKENIDQEILKIRSSLEKGMNVLLFPEGTSTNGLDVQRFKSTMFTAVEDTLIEVIPIAIKYIAVDETRIETKSPNDLRDLVHWYGSMDFVKHLWKLCGTRTITVSLKQTGSITSSRGLTRRNLADLSFDMIQREYAIL